MTSRIQVSLRVAATPQRTFAVFTRDIGAWWKPNPLFQFTSGPPGLLAFEPGPDGRLIETQPDGRVFEVGRISVWDPGRRLVFTWRQASFSARQSTEVEVRFDPVGEETRVTVEHRGWDSVPPDHVAKHHFPEAVFLQRHGEWWQALLGACRAAVQDKAPGE